MSVAGDRVRNAATEPMQATKEGFPAMSYQITGITVSSTPPTLGTITNYWFEAQNGETSGWKSKQEGVDHVIQHPHTVWVSGGGTSAWVEVVPNGNHPYLRTEGDSTTSDNLLSVKVY